MNDMRFRHHMLMATIVLAIVLPYVWLTNFTAHRLTILSHALILWVLIPMILYAMQKILIKSKVSIPLWLQIFLSFVGISLAIGIKLFIVIGLFSLPSEVIIVPQLFVAIMPIYTIYFIALAYRAFKDQEHAALSYQKLSAESAWKALAAQIKPHFLFNTLNTIEVLIEMDPKQAQTSIRHLSDLYRHVLSGSTKKWVSVGAELEVVEKYLFIQKQRFQNRLAWTVALDDELRSIEIPPQIMLSSVENAIKHGIEARPDGGEIVISISREQDHLLIVITNPKGLHDNTTGEGFGLRDLKHRLKIAYATGSECRVSNLGQLFTLTIRTPI
ncbi:MAG: histidine kinase [Pseudobacteriovorax sp.]|nr:histidine kinase [Pseudobacteriovorax sp.]